MRTAHEIPASFDAAVRELARSHADGYSGEVTIFWFRSPHDGVVRFVEVSDDYPSYGEDDAVAYAVAFRGSTDVPYQSKVIGLTPGDWERALAGTLALPEDWDLTSWERLWGPHA